jgi:hypothetical protein
VSSLTRFDTRALRWRDRDGRFIPSRRGRRKSDRLGRAIELEARRCVYPAGDGFAVVSVDGRHFYSVRLDGDEPTCNCPDALYRRPRCKHLLAAGLAARRLGELMRGDKMTGPQKKAISSRGTHASRDRQSNFLAGGANRK